jgi:hypothetical protein
MKAARMRSDSKAWEKAAESEMKSIADHDVLSRDFTLKELQEIAQDTGKWRVLRFKKCIIAWSTSDYICPQ